MLPSHHLMFVGYGRYDYIIACLFIPETYALVARLWLLLRMFASEVYVLHVDCIVSNEKVEWYFTWLSEQYHRKLPPPATSLITVLCSWIKSPSFVNLLIWASSNIVNLPFHKRPILLVNHTIHGSQFDQKPTQIHFHSYTF